MKSSEPTRGTDEEAGGMPEQESPPGIPGWVKLSGLIVVVLILLAITASFILGIEHGPGLHGSVDVRPDSAVEEVYETDR